MPKFKSYSPDEIIRILIQNGFELKRIRGSHRIYYNSIKQRRVVVPYHKKDIPIGTLLEIIKQAGIDKDEL